jgi:hypothetical protein
MPPLTIELDRLPAGLGAIGMRMTEVTQSWKAA